MRGERKRIVMITFCYEANRWLIRVFLEPAAGTFRPREVRTSLGLALAAVSLAGFVAACSGQAPAEGTLSGHLYGVGGRAPGLPRPWPGTVILTGPGIRRDIPVGSSGSYSVMVPPA